MRIAVLALLSMPISLIAPLHAQDGQQMAMPSREVFVDQQCVPALQRRTVLASETMQQAYTRAACECSYRLLAPHETVTRKLFDAASLLCQAEFDHGPDAFVTKYQSPASR